ncbi:MAG: copper transporter [bacterium]|jgi:cell division protein FtsB
MFINIRYLVVTLIAVFMALGIGILIGFQLDSNAIILRQQTELIASLESTFDNLTQTNQTLRTEVDNLQNILEQKRVFSENIATEYLRYKLDGLNIVIIEASEDLLYPYLKNTLQMAGANINASVVITDKVLAIDKIEQPSVAPISKSIVDSIAFGQTEGIKQLEQQGFVQVSGNFDIAPDFVILVGGNNTKTNKLETVDIPLIRELKKTSIRIVGVERSDIEHSCMECYQKEGISTVDNVDTIIGQTSLVLIMTGKEGNYGIKASANALLPYADKEELW